jgi:prepilin-type N-terminal cleavage/methylation domain-containing protein
MCQAHSPGPPRPAFTLVELLVALTIIVVIAMLALAVAPTLDSKTRSALGASQVQGWLFIAKQRALRDGLVCGVQLLTPDPSNPTWVTQLRYVEQPGPFTQGNIGSSTSAGTTPASVTFNLPPGVDLRTVVLPGDYLIINGTDPYVVASVDLTTPNTLNLTTALATTIPTGSAVPYRILRGPRPIDGEPDLLMPTDVIIDIGPLSVNVPANNTILFAPSGGAPQDGQTKGKIILWVRDSSRDLAFEGEPTLVTVFTRSGRIGAYPVNADSNGKTDSRGYYYFTQDGRTAGL